MQRTLLSLVGVILAAAPLWAGESPQHVSTELARYVLVLHDSSTKNEPDVAALGGRVLVARMQRRLIEIPSGRVEELTRHPRVAYLQRIWDGEQLPPWPAPAPSLKPLAVAAADSEPGWRTGTYSYDRSGNIISIGADQYRYDLANRLASAKVVDASRNYTYERNYAYDWFGNLRTTATGEINSATNRLKNGVYGEMGNLEKDPAGRVYEYDALGMIVTAPTTSDRRRMIYTADDERIAVVSLQDSVDKVTRVRVRDFGGRVLREFETTTTGTLWKRDYIYSDEALVAGEVQVATGQDGYRHYHLDHLGSVRLMSRRGDAARITSPKFEPFGLEVQTSRDERTTFGFAPLEPMKFTGHERDYTGPENVFDDEYVDYMHARYYSPAMGRFLSVDPVLGSAEEPQTWNRYSYVRNHPLSRIDPTGMADEVAGPKGGFEVVREALGGIRSGIMSGLGISEKTMNAISKPVEQRAEAIARAVRELGVATGTAIAEKKSALDKIEAVARDAGHAGNVILALAPAGSALNNRAVAAAARPAVIGTRAETGIVANRMGAARMNVPNRVFNALPRSAQNAACCAYVGVNIALGRRILETPNGGAFTRVERAFARLLGQPVHKMPTLPK